MPCYNAAPYVAAALESALAQTWPNKEIIVVNDGSNDGSGEILESFIGRGVKVVHQENRGQCAATNHALRLSKGAYIKFFDADDLLGPRTIELQMGRLAGSTTKVASAEWGRFYRDDLSTYRLSPQSVWRDMDPLDWLIEAWMDARPMMQCALWLIPREILNTAGGWDERLSLINDFEFFARVLCHAEEVSFTPGARLYYRSGIGGTLSGQKGRKAVESAFHSLLGGTEHLLARRDDKLARQACANVLKDFIYTYYPGYADLRALVAKRVRELGGSNLPASGPPKFEQLRRFTGWKVARRIQRLLGR